MEGVIIYIDAVEEEAHRARRIAALGCDNVLHPAQVCEEAAVGEDEIVRGHRFGLVEPWIRDREVVKIMGGGGVSDSVHSEPRENRLEFGVEGTVDDYREVVRLH